MILLADDLKRQLEIARFVREESVCWRALNERDLAERLFKLAVVLTAAALTLRDLMDMDEK